MSQKPRDAVIVAYGRSAVTKGRKGELANTHPIEYAGQVLKAVLAKVPQLDPNDIDEVVYGCTNLTGYQSYDIAKMIVARAGLPARVPAITVSRFCISGSDAICIAAAKIMSGLADVCIGGGVESMSLVPQPIPETRFDYQYLIDNIDKDIYLHVGLCAENDAKAHGISREDIDTLACESHRRAAAAQRAGKFDEEIIPVTVKDTEGNTVTVSRDGGIRENTSMEALANLKPCFDPNGIVTAGSSSQVSDGTGALVMMSREKAAALGLKPIARFVCYEAGSGSPAYLAPGVVDAIDRCTSRCGVSIQDMDVIELNEAFAPVVIAVAKHYGLDPAKVNPNGSAMALGHPLGATGAFLACKAFSELRRTGGKYGMVTMCAAIGQGGCAIYEMED